MNTEYKFVTTVNGIRDYIGGSRIVVKHGQEGNLRSSYGKSALQELFNRLTKEFGKGFSVRTLQQMKSFM